MENIMDEPEESNNTFVARKELLRRRVLTDADLRRELDKALLADDEEALELLFEIGREMTAKEYKEMEIITIADFRDIRLRCDSKEVPIDSSLNSVELELEMEKYIEIDCRPTGLTIFYLQNLIYDLCEKQYNETHETTGGLKVSCRRIEGNRFLLKIALGD